MEHQVNPDEDIVCPLVKAKDVHKRGQVKKANLTNDMINKRTQGQTFSIILDLIFITK